jgi:hypothetical protein
LYASFRYPARLIFDVGRALFLFSSSVFVGRRSSLFRPFGLEPVPEISSSSQPACSSDRTAS